MKHNNIIKLLADIVLDSYAHPAKMMLETEELMIAFCFVAASIVACYWMPFHISFMGKLWRESINSGNRFLLTLAWFTLFFLSLAGVVFQLAAVIDIVADHILPSLQSRVMDAVAQKRRRMESR